MSAKSKVFRGRAEDLRDVGSDERLQVIGDRFFHAADLLGRLREKTIREMLGELAPADRLMTRCEVGHRFVQVALVEQQVISVLQRHVGADLAQRFQRGSDVNLCLVLEEAFVTCLAERCSCVHDRLGEGVVRNAAVGREIVRVARLPMKRLRLPVGLGAG